MHHPEHGEQDAGESPGPPVTLDDDIQRAIRAGENRLPALYGGPYFIAPDSAPPIDAGTMARINPDSIGVEQVSLPDALNNGAAAEFKRLAELEEPGLREALRRIGRVARVEDPQAPAEPS